MKNNIILRKYKENKIINNPINLSNFVHHQQFANTLELNQNDQTLNGTRFISISAIP